MILALVNNPKPWIRKSIAILAALAIVFQWLFNDLKGVLFLSVALYIFTPDLFGYQPWQAGELLIWFGNLQSDERIGITSSLITVLGFFVALQSTMLSWRRQVSAQQRIAAGEAIDAVISKICKLILHIQLFVERLGSEVASARQLNQIQPTANILTILTEDVKVFRENRENLLQLDQEFSGLAAKHSTTLWADTGVIEALDAIDVSVRSVVKKIWMQVPIGDTRDPNHQSILVDMVDPQSCKELAEACDVAYDQISGIQGGIRGALNSQFTVLNFVALKRIIKQAFAKDAD